MRWESRVSYKDKPIPKVKFVRRFAWLPTKVGLYTVWLEFYFERMVYRIGGDGLLGYFNTYPSPTRYTDEEYKWLHGVTNEVSKNSSKS